MSKLNILVLGYYGKLNAGDDLLMQAMCYLFKEHNLMFSSWFPGLSLLNSCDLIVVGGGSIWPGNTFFELGDNLIKKLNKPYMVIGISTKQASVNVLANNQALIKNASLFLVRDEASKKILGNNSSIISGTDLFWTMPFDIERKLNDVDFKIGLNLRMWNNDISDYVPIVDTVKYHGQIIPFPMYFGSQIHETSASMSDVELIQALKIETVPRSFSVKALESCNIMVAMRFHAVLMSVRAGVPTIGFDYHPKIKSFFEENGLAKYCISLRDKEGLELLIKEIKLNHSKVSQDFQNVAVKLLREGEITRLKITEKLNFIKKEPLSFSKRVKRKLISFID